MTGPARHLPWLAGALLAAGSLVLALVSPSSWWAVTFVAGVLGAMLGARPVVRAGYRRYWTRSVVLVTLGAALGGGAYAFAVEPWGPVPQIAWPLGILLLVIVFVPVADMIPSGISPGASWMGKEGRRGHTEWVPDDRRSR